MLFDGVRSLVMCNLFSHALFWCAWPPARSGFSFTLNMSEAKVRLRTMTDTNSAQTRKTGLQTTDFRYILKNTESYFGLLSMLGLFLPTGDSEVVFEHRRLKSRRISILSTCVFKPYINKSEPEYECFVDLMGCNLQTEDDVYSAI